jgi:hypothetical protein
MTVPVMDVFQREVGRGWLQASLSVASSPKAALLVVPPFFHEWQRCYRIFALLADALARRDITVLRFDYRGTGDSSGTDDDFLPSRALDDADAALALLRERCPAPVTLLGIRAGALLAEQLAARRSLPWWTWQPVEDGACHLGELRERDRFERNNRLRFPYLRGECADDPGVLMGHRLHPEFALELAIFRRGSAASWRLDTAAACGHDDLALPTELTLWVEQVDLQGGPALSSIGRIADAIARRLAERTDGAAT